jgi:hypothetical protein
MRGYSFFLASEAGEPEPGSSTDLAAAEAAALDGGIAARRALTLCSTSTRLAATAALLLPAWLTPG